MTPALRQIVLTGGGGGAHDLAGLTVLQFIIGDSNAKGDDSASNISPTLDAPVSRSWQYLDPLGSELLPSDVAAGTVTTGWSTAACTLAVVNSELVATVTSGSNPRFFRTLSGLTIGEQLCIEFDQAWGIDLAVINGRVDAPQTQRGVSTSGRSSLRYYMTPSATSVTIYMISATASPGIGQTFGAAGFSVRKVLATGAATFNERPHRDPMDWPEDLVGAGTPVVGLSASGVSAGSRAAQGFINRGALKVLNIPLAKKGSKLVASPAEWGVGGTLNTDFLAKATQVRAQYPDAICGVTLSLGANDAPGGASKADFKTALLALISDTRAVLGADCTFAILGMTPEYMAANAPAATLAEAYAEIVASDPLVILAPGSSGYSKDSGLHWVSAGLRLLGADVGRRMPFVTA